MAAEGAHVQSTTEPCIVAARELQASELQRGCLALLTCFQHPWTLCLTAAENEDLRALCVIREGSAGIHLRRHIAPGCRSVGSECAPVEPHRRVCAAFSATAQGDGGAMARSQGTLGGHRHVVTEAAATEGSKAAFPETDGAATRLRKSCKRAACTVSCMCLWESQECHIR
jgi:hypothetical protein